jgi:hypothetical protein
VTICGTGRDKENRSKRGAQHCASEGLEKKNKGAQIMETKGAQIGKRKASEGLNTVSDVERRSSRLLA